MRASIVTLLDRLPGTVGVVLSAAFEILAWNDLAAALLGDPAESTPEDRSLARRAFLPDVARRTRTDVADMSEFRHHVVSQLRAASARYPDDPMISDLITELRSNSADFDRLWQRHDVQPQPIIVKTFRHPEVGAITVDCDTLLLPDRDQQLVLFTAQPGSRDAANLDLLRVITPAAANDH